MANSDGINDEIREECCKLVLSTINHANSLPKDSDEFKKAVDEFQKVYGVYLDQGKADCQYDEAYQKRVEEFRKRKSDDEFREKQLAQQHKEFRQKLVADCVTNGIKIAFLAVVGKWSSVLEGVSVISSGTAKNFIRETWKNCFDMKK